MFDINKLPGLPGFSNSLDDRYVFYGDQFELGCKAFRTFVDSISALPMYLYSDVSTNESISTIAYKSVEELVKPFATITSQATIELTTRTKDLGDALVKRSAAFQRTLSAAETHITRLCSRLTIGQVGAAAAIMALIGNEFVPEKHKKTKIAMKVISVVGCLTALLTAVTAKSLAQVAIDVLREKPLLV